jgi:DNA-binding Lrp family transcriptional regulator
MTQDSTDQPDRLDMQLLRALSDNGRATQFALGEELGRSPSAIARRQRVLEEEGIIAGYRADLDLGRLGLGTIVHVKVALNSQREDALDAFEAAIAQCPSVIRCDLMSGTDDYLIAILARSLDDFARIHREQLSRLPGVMRMESGFVLREVVKPRLPPALFAKVK